MCKQKSPLPPTPPTQTATATAGIRGTSGKPPITGSPEKAVIPVAGGASAASEMPAALWAPTYVGIPSIARSAIISKECQQQQETPAKAGNVSNSIGSTSNSKDSSSAQTPATAEMQARSWNPATTGTTKN